MGPDFAFVGYLPIDKPQKTKRLKELETENHRLKKLLAESLLENEVTREVLRKKW